MSVDRIIVAARAGDQSRVAELLDEDASLVSAANMFGSQAVHAAYFLGHRDIFDLLLAPGLKIDPFLAAELGMIDRLTPEAARIQPARKHGAAWRLLLGTGRCRAIPARSWS